MYKPLEEIKLTRVEANTEAPDGSVVPYRRYISPVGLVPSVTSINAGVANAGKEAALANWAAQYPEVADVVAENGTLNHEDIEHYIKHGAFPAGKCPGGLSEVQFAIVEILQRNGSDIQPGGYRQSFLHIAEMIDEVLICESSVYHDWGYAGSMDCMARLKDGRIVGMDWKSPWKTKKSYPKSYQKDYCLQGAAYGLAVYTLYDILIDEHWIVNLSPVGDYPVINRLDRPELRRYAQQFRNNVFEFYEQNPHLTVI